jgi:hypothetical protein
MFIWPRSSITRIGSGTVPLICFIKALQKIKVENRSLLYLMVAKGPLYSFNKIVHMQLCRLPEGAVLQRRESALGDDLFRFVLLYVCDREKYYLKSKQLKSEEIELLDDTKAYDTQLT